VTGQIRSTCSKTSPSGTSSTTNLRRTGLGLNLGLHIVRVATNCLMMWSSSDIKYSGRWIPTLRNILLPSSVKTTCQHMPDNHNLASFDYHCSVDEDSSLLECDGKYSYQHFKGTGCLHPHGSYRKTALKIAASSSLKRWKLHTTIYKAQCHRKINLHRPHF
jgi:hypothetical protein